MRPDCHGFTQAGTGRLSARAQRGPGGAPRQDVCLGRALIILSVLFCLGLAFGLTPAQADNRNLEKLTPPETLVVPAGSFIVGSDRAEREAAYQLDEAAYGHSVTLQQRWYEGEGPRRQESLPAFHIMKEPVTNEDYAAFLVDSGHRLPDVQPAVWESYGLIHPYSRTRRHAWTDGSYPEGRRHHPVVLVSHADARAYARWLSQKTGKTWRLPTRLEWEKAVRGSEGQRWPWGKDWQADRLNSHDLGPFDTLPVGSFPAGASPFGLLDGSGQVYEWTASPRGTDHHWVKGGSWDDKGCGVCRPAAGHSRPNHLKHILIGFRLVREME
ncbi:formylglycine-generating enzyme family protein [Rhodovibrionaceae bacterium A322]